MQLYKVKVTGRVEGGFDVRSSYIVTGEDQADAQRKVVYHQDMAKYLSVTFDVDKLKPQIFTIYSKMTLDAATLQRGEPTDAMPVAGVAGGGQAQLWVMRGAPALWAYSRGSALNKLAQYLIKLANGMSTGNALFRGSLEIEPDEEQTAVPIAAIGEQLQFHKRGHAVRVSSVG